MQKRARDNPPGPGVSNIESRVETAFSLGERRSLLVRPKGGGQSQRFELGRGDLLVMGGNAQRDWQHSVPKRAAAGARLSIALRHAK